MEEHDRLRITATVYGITGRQLARISQLDTARVSRALRGKPQSDRDVQLVRRALASVVEGHVEVASG